MTLLIVIVGGIISIVATKQDVSFNVCVLYFAIWFVAIAISWTGSRIEKYIRTKNIEERCKKVIKDSEEALKYMEEKHESDIQKVVKEYMVMKEKKNDKTL